MSFPKNMKIHELFEYIADCPHFKTEEDKQSMYDTVRALIQAKRFWNLPNSLLSTIIEDERVFDYLVENFRAVESGQHIKNFDILTDIYHGLYDIVEDEDEEDSEDTEDTDDEDYEVDDETDDEESDEDSDDDVCEKATLVLDVHHPDMDALGKKLVHQHKKTRWLLGAHFMLTAAHIVMGIIAIKTGMHVRF